jgi:hypothetical protein
MPVYSNAYLARAGPEQIMKQHLKTALICLAVVCTSIGGTCAETNLVLNIERIALFKNGLGYATATTTLPAGDSRVFRLGQLPVPTYGTFWVGYGNKVKLRKLGTALEPVTESMPVSTVDELLRLNPGMRVVVHLANSSSGEPAVVSGVVQSLPAARTNNEPPSPYFMDVRRGPERPPYYYYGYPYAPPAGQQMVLVKTDRGIVALNPGSIQRAELLGNPVCVRTNEQQRPAISMELEAPAAGEKIAVSYLARGITWVPSYHIDLSDAKTARFSAQAQIINEMADLNEVQVELVTGFPNIQFPELPNPVAMSQTLAEFLRALAAGRAEGVDRSHMMMQQQALAMNSIAYPTTPLPEYAIASNAQAAEDLFLYPLRKVSLKRGETATIPLLTADMPYRHLYTWKIADLLDADASRPLPGGRSAEEVWHTCRMVNAAKMPLTTAAAEFVKDGQFVGQDTCYYTVPGAEASIRINRAMNVQAEQAEMEVDRKRNAANFYGRGYDLVKLKGELKIANRLAREIEIEITKDLSGEVLEKTGNPTDVQTARGLKQVNTKHQLTWLTKLAAGEEQRFSYTYQLYISP